MMKSLRYARPVTRKVTRHSPTALKGNPKTYRKRAVTAVITRALLGNAIIFLQVFSNRSTL